MKTIFLLILLFTFNLFSREYIIYPEDKYQGSQIKEQFDATDIYTQKEKSFIPNFKSKHALKVALNNKSLKLLKLKYPNCSIEQNLPAKSFNKYQSLQWSLDNKGETIKRWISDIDVRYIQGVKDEDINIDNNETKKKIRIAIVDSGVDLNHPDLKGQFYSSPKECEDLTKYNNCVNTENDKSICYKKYATTDHNNNGYPLDCNGWNVTGKSNPQSEVTGNSNIIDLTGHGTHIAGIIGAKDNNIGIKGIIQNVELLPVQVGVTSNSETKTDVPTDNIAKGVLYAIRNKSHIINLSLGWRINQDSLLMREMIELATKRNILIVAAAGNDSHDETVYPCSYKGVICVASHDIDGKISNYSNFGAHIDITAPGNDILSTFPTNLRSRSFTQDANYEYMSGTSQAAPHVSGVLARLLNQGIDAKLAKAQMLNSARKKNSSHKWIRFGNVDYKKALKAQEEIAYITNKTPALINISKNKDFSFSIMTSSKIEVNIQSDELRFTKSTWSLNENKQEQKLKTSISNEKINKKSYFVEVSISSKKFNYKYFIQINPLMVINNTNKSKRLQRKEVLSGRKFKPAIVKLFDNFYDQKNEYAAIKSSNGRLIVQALLDKDSEYISSRSFQIKDKNNLIIGIYKADIDIDGKVNYIIVRADLDDKDRKIRFDVLDHKFIKIDYQICPNNEFINTYTTMPADIVWTRRRNKLVPTWISFGLNPDYVQDNPWAHGQDPQRKSRIYQLTSEGLIDIDMGNNISASSFLNQSSDDKLNGKVYFISSNGTGYKKKFSTFILQDSKVKYLRDINLNSYFNFESTRPQTLVGEDRSGAFYSYSSILGSQEIVALQIKDEQLLIKEKTINPLDVFDPIIRTLRFSMSGEAISQTSKKLLVHNDNHTYSRSSYTNTSRVKHYLLTSEMGLILPQSETFNLSSYTLIYDGKNVLEPSYLQTFAPSECLEIGVEKDNREEFLSYYCEDIKKIFKLKVSL